MQDDSGRGSESASWGMMAQTVVRHHGNSVLQDVICESTSLRRPPENDDSRGHVFNSLEESALAGNLQALIYGKNLHQGFGLVQVFEQFSCFPSLKSPLDLASHQLHAP